MRDGRRRHGRTPASDPGDRLKESRVTVPVKAEQGSRARATISLPVPVSNEKGALFTEVVVELELVLDLKDSPSGGPKFFLGRRSRAKAFLQGARLAALPAPETKGLVI